MGDAIAAASFITGGPPPARRSMSMLKLGWLVMTISQSALSFLLFREVGGLGPVGSVLLTAFTCCPVLGTLPAALCLLWLFDWPLAWALGIPFGALAVLIGGTLGSLPRETRRAIRELGTRQRREEFADTPTGTPPKPSHPPPMG